MDYFLCVWDWNELEQLNELNSSRIRRSKLHEIREFLWNNLDEIKYK